ncbi:LysM peptidoglycan-binding domain-containing protein [Streptacidiphilus anmyonensis]|uniref:LysM peptidoglycan-binding domain-containing protein n=1 Tax=Streptacidiphilus anmyonensis TaxID=405782 RepID=UPI0005A9B645|nr:LysM peptidoglycan-binding domain-containing protein [Streptacidiphilus anmyonensis]
MDSGPLPRLLKGLGALAALSALEAGVPLALLAWGTNPHQVPTWQQTTDALTGPDNGSLFLGALTVIGWLAWALFTVQVLLELIAVLRHRAAPRLPVLGAGQHLAATLVAAAVLLLPTTGTALAQGAPHTAAAATLHLPHHTAPSPQQVAVAVGAQAEADQAGPVHHVSAGDETLWGLAERYLGDGTRWKDIAALNQGIVQSDGQTLTPTTLHLVPGWTLRLPADAHARPPRHTSQHTHDVHQVQHHAPDTDPGADERGDTSSPDGVRERVHIVRPGETLSQIAQDDLGNADAYPAIYQASTGITQSGGQHLTDPNLILPGWKLDIPQPATAPTPGQPGGAAHAGGGRDGGHSATPTPTAPTATAPAGTPTASPSTAPTSTPATGPVGAPTASATAVPSRAPASPATPGTPTAAPSTPGAATSSAAPSATAVTPASADDSQAGSELRIGLAISALLAAGLLGGYGIKRALQQRSRRPGETIAVPAETSSLEQILANQADPATAELLDLALRTMATHLPDGEPLPQLEVARIERTRIQLRADGPAIAPFTSGEDGWWNLDPAAQLLDPPAAYDVAAPYPMLATLGKEPDGTLVLVDLAAARTLLLDGTTQQVREVARALALDAATSPWGQELQVLSAGLIEAGLPQMMATGRIRRLDRIGHAVTDLADQLLTAHQDPDAEMPWMLVASDHIDEETAWELAGLVSRSPNAPVALALPGEGLDALFPDALRLDCAITEPQPLPHNTAPVQLQRVTEAEYQILTEDLRTTEQPANKATGAWTRVPDDTRTPAQPPTDQTAAADESGPAETDGAPTGTVTPFLAFAGQSGNSPTQATPMPVLLTSAPSGGVALPSPVALAADEAADATALTVDVPTQSTPVIEPADLHAPEIRLLGPVDVTGLGSSGRGRRLAEVAAFLYLRPNRTRDNLAEAMSPNAPWTEKSVTQRIHDLRNLLGNAPDGTPRLARNARDGVLPTMTGVRSDWARFCKLAERGLLAGPAGVDDLEAALALVRARPFAGSTARWSMPDAQEMVSRIVDTAHTIARYRTDTGHYDQARAAIAVGIDVEPAAEMLYRDWLALEAACGNTAEVHRIISRLQEELRTLDVEMDHATEELIEAIFEQHMKGSA